MNYNELRDKQEFEDNYQLLENLESELLEIEEIIKDIKSPTAKEAARMLLQMICDRLEV